MKKLIGIVVSIPELNEEGIVCGFDDNSNTFVVETDYGWIEGLKQSQIEPIVGHQAPKEQQQYESLL